MRTIYYESFLYFGCRSLSRTPVTMWYDDGMEGVEQGHLILGQVIMSTNKVDYHLSML